MDAPTSADRCPKAMRFGPCGGLAADGGCEVPGVRCPFADAVRLPVAGPHHTPRPAPFIGRFVVDLRLGADLDDAVRRSPALATRSAVALFGEHLDDPGISPAGTARRAQRAGVPAIVTVTGRKRSLAQAEREITSIIAHDATGVLCVTGDHPRARFPGSPDVSFGAEGTTIASAARRAGAPCVVVGESPGSGSAALRVRRLATKADAGADVAVLNHAGEIDESIAFARAVHESGNAIALVAPVPVITSRESARRLAAFPGLRLPTGVTDRIADSADAAGEGVAVAAELSARLLASGWFCAVNLSGGAGLATAERLETSAEIIDRTRSLLEPSTGGVPNSANG